MRAAYGTYGVEGYYKREESSYRNPHFGALTAALSDVLDAAFSDGGDGDGSGLARLFAGDADGASCCKTQLAESNVLRIGGGTSGSGSSNVGGGGEAPEAAAGPAAANKPRVLRVLDLACGSGEASLALFAWLSRRCRAATPSLCAVRELHLTAADPFLGPAFTARTGLPRVHAWSFEDVQAGALDGCGCAPDAGCGGRNYDLAAVSFALHLLDPTRLHETLTALARAAKWLLLLSPHKRPHVDGGAGWRLEAQLVTQRVHARLYESELLLPPT